MSTSMTVHDIKTIETTHDIDKLGDEAYKTIVVRLTNNEGHVTELTIFGSIDLPNIILKENNE